MTAKYPLNLPQTSFPMKAGLSENEPRWIAYWQKEDIYAKRLQEREMSPLYTLNDGPPYANGPIHIGHAVNKILKDIVMKAKALEGYRTPYIPGWDCHGLPIEIQVEKEIGTAKDPAAFREACRNYAEKQILRQKEGFCRLGILADWDNPYKTMDFSFEAEVVRLFGSMLHRELIIPGLKPVHWCPHCASSLSEAEIEYTQVTSDAIDVVFHSDNVLTLDGQSYPLAVVIWTTTPWTLPSNQAVAYGPDINYVALIVGQTAYMIAAELLEQCCERFDIDKNTAVTSAIPQDLWPTSLHHPFDHRTVPLLPADHVTTDMGTGFVHTAPDHGPDDFALGRAHGLLPLEYLDSRGRFTSARPDLAGLGIKEAGQVILQRLKDNGTLLSHAPLEHAYQICWRHKKPIFYRATPQWFVRLSENFRQEILAGIDKVQWYPAWGCERMKQMIATRPDWCISRQRYWGTPLVLIYHPETRQIHPNMGEIIERVAEKISESGLEAWFGSVLADWGVDETEGWVKSRDTLDVWFDSGAVFHLLLAQKDAFPASLYLEGTDQYRGWFQSSLICAMGHQGEPPYKEILTHGFIVDADGKKMSKSLGNVVAPSDVANKFGIDVLRLWVSCSNYREEMAIGDDILARVSDTYRRLRNTLRFMLGNLYDFEERDLLAPEQMAILDRAIVEKVFEQQQRARAAYEKHDFHEVVRPIIDFCVNDLGGFYLDIIKDRLYTAAPASQARRSAQTALYYLFISLTHQLAPVLSFTMEEAWQSAAFIKDKRSIFFNRWPDNPWTQQNQLLTAEQRQAAQEAQDLREKLQVPLEKMRQDGLIGSSLEAHVLLYLPQDSLLWSWEKELKFVFLTSGCTIKPQQEALSEPWVLTKLSYEKCPRCWHRVEELTPLCARCDHNLHAPEGERRAYA